MKIENEIWVQKNKKLGFDFKPVDPLFLNGKIIADNDGGDINNIWRKERKRKSSIGSCNSKNSS